MVLGGNGAGRGLMDVRTVTEGLAFPEGPVVCADGSVILVEIAAGAVTRVAPDGSKTIVAKPGGGPNGAAIGPDGKGYVVNNGGFAFLVDDQGRRRPTLQAHDYSGGRLERIDLATGAVEVLYRECGGHGLRGPNDLVCDAHGGIYFTDLGKRRARDMDVGGVYYAKRDGSSIVEVAYPLVTPNGIGLSPEGNTLYVAETGRRGSGRSISSSPESSGKTRGRRRMAGASSPGWAATSALIRWRCRPMGGSRSRR